MPHATRSSPGDCGTSGATAAVLFVATTAFANVAVTQVSSDPFTDAQAQHRTEVEPDTFTFGTTIVGAFQIGRVFGGGSSDTGFATSKDGGGCCCVGRLVDQGVLDR